MDHVLPGSFALKITNLELATSPAAASAVVEHSAAVNQAVAAQDASLTAAHYFPEPDHSAALQLSALLLAAKGCEIPEA